MHEALTDARRRNPAPSPRSAEEKVGLRSPPDGALTRLAARGDLSQLRWARWQSARALDAHLLGRHIASGATLSIEVIQRRIDDRGGPLARVNGTVRLVEGLALPR